MFYRFQLIKYLYVYNGHESLGHELVDLPGTCDRDSL